VIPEHIATAEYFPPAPSDDRSRLVFSIKQISERFAREDEATKHLKQTSPTLLGSYSGFNILRVNEYYYAVRHSLGHIDWALSHDELVTRYSEGDFFYGLDRNILLYRVGVDELLTYIEELSSLNAEIMLRQDALVRRLFASDPAPQPRLLKENYRGFSLIAAEGKIWAATPASPVDFHDPGTREQLMTGRHLLEATTMDGALAALDRLIDRKATQAAIGELQSQVEKKLDNARLLADEKLTEIDQHVALQKNDLRELKEFCKRLDAIVTQDQRTIRQLNESQNGIEGRIGRLDTVVSKYNCRMSIRFKRWLQDVCGITNKSGRNGHGKGSGAGSQ
jgi:hypothetical protein